MKKLFSLLLLVYFFNAETKAQTAVDLSNLMFTDEWFSSLEEAKANAEKVWYLDLGLQKLKTFPKEILTFKNVKHLYLQVNYWPSVPEKIGSLKNLEILDLSSNYYLKTLPEGLKDCTALKQLILKDHKLNSGEIARIKKLLPNVQVITD